MILLSDFAVFSHMHLYFTVLCCMYFRSYVNVKESFVPIVYKTHKLSALSIVV